jgi:hypothetical protein
LAAPTAGRSSPFRTVRSSIFTDTLGQLLVASQALQHDLGVYQENRRQADAWAREQAEFSRVEDAERERRAAAGELKSGA